jgi:hypothetical protein
MTYKFLDLLHRSLALHPEYSGGGGLVQGSNIYSGLRDGCTFRTSPRDAGAGRDKRSSPASLAGNGTQSFRNDVAKDSNQSDERMSVYHNSRFPPAQPALGVRDFNAEQIAFRSLPESTDSGLAAMHRRSPPHVNRLVASICSRSKFRTLPCHGTFGQFRTQLGSGGNGREQSGTSGAIYAGA